MADGDMCQKIDPNVQEPIFACTLPPEHVPAENHRCDYRETDPDLGWPFTRPAFHEWTTPVGA